LPYFHILPKKCYRYILKLGKESEATINSYLDIKETGISVHRFQKIMIGYCLSK
jgi:hypothetical protein